MNKELSQKVMHEFNAISKNFNVLTELSFEIDDLEEQKQFRKNLSQMYGKLYIDIIMPIEDDFPELKME